MTQLLGLGKLRQAYQTGIQLDFDLHSENNLYSNSWPYTKANLIDLSDLVSLRSVIFEHARTPDAHFSLDEISSAYYRKLKSRANTVAGEGGAY